MIPILTLTLNPALDLATSAEAVRADTKLRCAPPRIDPGGGGINVARAVRQLGGDAFALVAAGGPTGAQLQALLAAEGVLTGLLAAPGDTRISLSVADEATGAQYRFMLPGPEWHEADVAIALSMLKSATRRAAIACFRAASRRASPTASRPISRGPAPNAAPSSSSIPAAGRSPRSSPSPAPGSSFCG